jgi:Sigma-70, region 4
MSAALQLPMLWEAAVPARNNVASRGQRPAASTKLKPAAEPVVSLAFYRKHTEKTLRRYLYASMQVGRAPNILGEPIGRGWVSSRPVRTFEDAVIFVLDVETCLNSLGSLDRQMLYRVAIQEYTHAEAGTLLGMSVRSVSAKFPQALDNLTAKLLEAELLVLPN